MPRRGRRIDLPTRYDLGRWANEIMLASSDRCRVDGGAEVADCVHTIQHMWPQEHGWTGRLPKTRPRGRGRRPREGYRCPRSASSPASLAVPSPPLAHPPHHQVGRAPHPWLLRTCATLCPQRRSGDVSSQCNCNNADGGGGLPTMVPPLCSTRCLRNTPLQISALK